MVTVVSASGWDIDHRVRQRLRICLKILTGPVFLFSTVEIDSKLSFWSPGAHMLASGRGGNGVVTLAEMHVRDVSEGTGLKSDQRACLERAVGSAFFFVAARAQDTHIRSQRTGLVLFLGCFTLA